MSRNYRLFWFVYLIQDLYWRFIPLNCRCCIFLKQCRSGFFKGRKCYNGCIKLNILREQHKEEDFNDYFDSLLEYVDKNWSNKNG